MNTEKGSIDLFLELSQILTGEDQLNRELAAAYHERIQQTFGETLDALLKAYDERADEIDTTEAVGQLVRDDQLGIVAREITMLWYVTRFQVPIPGQLDDQGRQKFEEQGPKRPEHNFQALIWPTIRAHPLGLSGGYFGYWHYPPEN